MTDRMRIGQLHVPQVPPGTLRKPAQSGSAVQSEAPSFQSVLHDKLIRFSHHAEVRLKQRGITWNTDRMAKLETAVSKAAAKGARESLIMFQDVALIVNVKNRTVVTAMDGNQMQDNVITQIDSAVIVR